MTHDFLNDLQVGFVLAEASAECVPQDMAAKLWQKNRVTIFFLRLGFFFLIIVCTNRADSAVDGIGEINLSITSAENKAGVPINFIGAETNDLLILVFFQKGIEHFINHWNNADASFRFGRVYMVGASAIFLHTINKIVVDVYNTYKRLVYHTAYKIMGDSYLAEDVLQEVFLYVAKNFSKIHRENCHELAAYLVSCSRSRAYDMLRKQREEPLEEVPDAPDDAPVPDDAVVSTDNIQHLTELIGQMKPMYRDPLRLLAMGYTNREIAESLGLTDEVVRMRLFRGRKLLWKELNGHE